MIDVVDRIRVDRDGRTRYHFVLIDYLCRPTGGTLCCATDAADATWAAVNDLARFEIAEATVQMIYKGAERLRTRSATP
jgi:hypothetical protein